MREMTRLDLGLSLPICDCCRREVEYVRSSVWHYPALICLECFFQWYDPDTGSFDNCNPTELGNYVRSKHGLAPIAPTE